jgi:hypothetical protein
MAGILVSMTVALRSGHLATKQRAIFGWNRNRRLKKVVIDYFAKLQQGKARNVIDKVPQLSDWESYFPHLLHAFDLAFNPYRSSVQIKSNKK